MDDRPSLSARDYVESLHQNSRATLLYGKNNVLVQPVREMLGPGLLGLGVSIFKLQSRSSLWLQVAHPFIHIPTHTPVFSFICQYSISPSIHPCDNIFFYPSIHASIHSCIHSSNCSFFHLYIHPFSHSSIHLPTYLSLHSSTSSPSLCPFIHMTFPSIHPSTHPSIHLYIHPSTPLFFF